MEVMKNPLRSSFSTEGRRMAGARALWRAVGMKEEQFGKPIIAVVNSFTQFVPGHVHLHEVGQLVKAEIEKLGCFAAEFNTIAIDDGIAMGHDGMLYLYGVAPFRLLLFYYYSTKKPFSFRRKAPSNIFSNSQRSTYLSPHLLTLRRTTTRSICNTLFIILLEYSFCLTLQM